MKDYTYYVITEKNETTGKEIAHAEKINNVFRNLLKIKPQHQDFKIISIVACNTFKSAKDIANHLNGRYEYIENGKITYRV